jgi:ribosomal protein S18 acetylase RimI-like enzyme
MEAYNRMDTSIQICTLRPFTQADIWPILTGYETQEIYAVEKTETDLHTVFDIHLVQLEKPYRADFYEDFPPEEIQWQLSYLHQGYSFGAYQNDRLIGFALAEAQKDEPLLRVWEFHVMDGFRRMGVGRALMQNVIETARQNHLAMIMLETQNTNVKAVRFYRSMGYHLDSLDLSPLHYGNQEGKEVKMIAFYMKQKLKKV